MTSMTTSVRWPFMDEVEEMLMSNDISNGMSYLNKNLYQLKNKLTHDEWISFSHQDCLKHSLAEVILQDPFTLHSYNQPRGYAGDAELLDYIYGFRLAPAGTTAIGQNILKFSANLTASAQGVRTRRDILAKLIDSVAWEKSYPIKVLSIACGHLREAGESKALTEGKIEKLFALDQDPLSLQLIQDEYEELPIETIKASITAIIRQKIGFEDLDLVYAAGLYDYLSQPLARRLTKIMFDMLRPGGKLLVANFTPDHLDIGYMETFMRWNLIYRDRNQLLDVSMEIPSERIGNIKLFPDKASSILCLELEKV